MRKLFLPLLFWATFCACLFPASRAYALDVKGNLTVTGKITTPIINLTGGQIAFPAAQSASADANTLDDYEEGTWTPGITFGGGSVGITYSSTKGYYTKVGNIVSVTGDFILSSKGTSTGAVQLNGLPFTILNDSGATPAGNIVYFRVTFTSGNQVLCFGNYNNTTIEVFQFAPDGTYSQLTNGNFANNSEVLVNFTYRVN